MGNVIFFTHPYGGQKMEEKKIRNTFAQDFLAKIKNSGNTEETLEPKAVAQLVRGWYTGQSKSLLAFPVIELARDLGIQVVVKDFSSLNIHTDGTEGMTKGYLGLYSDESKKAPKIVVSEAESYGHQRWTVAHELWHYICHADESRKEEHYYSENSSNYNLTDDSEEASANRFATELLMPESLFKFVYKTSSFWRRKFKLSEIFMVSEEAVYRRIHGLNL